MQTQKSPVLRSFALQDYQKELQRLLEDAKEEDDCAADSRLCQLTLEALRFRGFSLSFTFSGNSTKAVTVPPPLPPDLHKQVEHIVVRSGIIELEVK